MALKRLDEEFDLKPGTKLLPYMQRLLPSLEGRFQDLEAEQDVVNKLAADIRAAALLRMNEILIPATEDIIAVTKLGFLIAPCSQSLTLVLGYNTMIIDEGPQRDTFTPSPYLIVEHSPDDYAIARLISYSQETGLLELTVTAIHGSAGPWDDWAVSSTPGMADSTKLYHDAVAPMHDTVVADTAEVIQLHAEILAAAEALAESGLDAYAFIRKDGTVPFEAVQVGIAPAPGANNAHIVTAAWSRARMIEYTATSVTRTGDQMTGPLLLSRNPVATNEAATKAYVDSILGIGGVMQGPLTLNYLNPTFAFRTTGAGQNRFINALSPAGINRWSMVLGDAAAESGGDAGSNFALYRYGDSGSLLDNAFWINRQTGRVTISGGVTVGAGMNITGGVNIIGDLNAYRAASPNTGVIYLNQSRSAYHFYDGATHNFTAGGISCAGSPLYCGHMNTYSIYTQGHAITTWGLTSHGHVQVNSTLRAQALYVQSTGPMINMEDSDWGTQFIHHQGGNIGFLNYNGAWVWYVNYNGHFWTPQYGWMHDYVNQQASAYAWNAADTRYNQLVSSLRWVHSGDLDWYYYYYQIAEIGNSAITGLHVIGSAHGYGHIVYAGRWRQLQHMIAGGWYTTYWAS